MKKKARMIWGLRWWGWFQQRRRAHRLRPGWRLGLKISHSSRCTGSRQCSTEDPQCSSSQDISAKISEHLWRQNYLCTCNCVSYTVQTDTQWYHLTVVNQWRLWRRSTLWGILSHVQVGIFCSKSFNCLHSPAPANIWGAGWGMMAAAAAGEGRSEDALPSAGFEFGFNPQLGSGGPHFGCATSSYLCKAQDSSLLICRHLREGFFYFEYGSSRIVASSE